MKKILLIIFYPLTILSANAQSITLTPSVYFGNFRHFNNLKGLDISYQHKITKLPLYAGVFAGGFYTNRTLTFQYLSPENNQKYDIICYPKNKLFKVGINLNYALIHKDNYALFAGIEGSLNSMKRDEIFMLVANKPFPKFFYAGVQGVKKNRPGLGFELSTQRKVSKQIWIFLNYRPSLIGYDNNESTDAYDPKKIFFNSFGLGLIYRKEND